MISGFKVPTCSGYKTQPSSESYDVRRDIQGVMKLVSHLHIIDTYKFLLRYQPKRNHNATRRMTSTFYIILNVHLYYSFNTILIALYIVTYIVKQH